MEAPIGQPPADLVELGRVAGAYGLRGWIRIEPYSVQSAVLLRTRQWWLVPDGKSPEQGLSVRILKSRTQGSAIVAHPEGCDDRDAAEAWRKQRVWVSRATFPPPEEDEYYWVDLIGCQLYGQDGESPVLLGEVTDVTDNGAHAVLHVACMEAHEDGLRPVLDAKGKPCEVLVPFVAAHVHTVDLALRRIDTDWPVAF